MPQLWYYVWCAECCPQSYLDWDLLTLLYWETRGAKTLQSSLALSAAVTQEHLITPTKYQVFNLERNPIPSPAHLSAMKTKADRTRV